MTPDEQVRAALNQLVVISGGTAEGVNAILEDAGLSVDAINPSHPQLCPLTMWLRRETGLPDNRRVLSLYIGSSTVTALGGFTDTGVRIRWTTPLPKCVADAVALFDMRRNLRPAKA